MKIHEYQAKEILRKYSVPLPQGKVAFSADEVPAIAEFLASNVLVVKAQIHAGGRGKGGGVKVAKTTEDAQRLTEEIIGMQLVTHQTGPEGRLVKKVLIEEGCNIDKEFYAGIVLDRSTSRNCFMVSTEGGMEIEKVAEENPEKIIKEFIDPTIGFQPFQARKLAFALGLADTQFKNAINFFTALYKAYEQTDASLFEINPLVITKEGDVIALDSKVNFDDNALFRHKDFLELRDIDEEDPLEVEAGKFGLNYIRLDGEVGCMVNGAGLAMATMDIIKLHGGNPANFLDVGGSAEEEGVLINTFIMIKI
jgi:succinyl-CoA synthetase beta subunit